MPYYVYIITNKPGGTLYIGVTNNLERRIQEHKQRLIEGFATRYYLFQLIYYEIFDGIQNAIEREKQLKNWNRQWKIELIEAANPFWADLCNSDMPSQPQDLIS